ncbi:MAG: YbjN domain-containing protein [Sedimentisphaerales bacterium]|jgi:hypothetical protein|nr:YbjN domain-containing protein [Sedimentisphaerales bacterium]
MTEEMITPENISSQLLKAAFESAYMDVLVDEDGDLRIKDVCNIIVRPDLERRNRIRLLSLFRFKEDSTLAQRLQCVNNINSEFIMVCASVTDNGLLVFRHDMMLDGGLTAKTLILSTKRFASIPHAAIEEFGSDIVV